MASQGIKPDLTLLLDCPAEIGLSRTAQRRSQIGAAGQSEDRFEREKLEFHERIRAGFLELARAEPGRFRIINAAGSARAVAEEIRNIIEGELL
jgi:dTMP kinase